MKLNTGIFITLSLSLMVLSSPITIIADAQEYSSIQVTLVPLIDSYGHQEVNMDGTHYRGDRVRVDVKVDSAPAGNNVQVSIESGSLPRSGYVVYSTNDTPYGNYPINVSVTLLDPRHKTPIQTKEVTLDYTLVPYNPKIQTFPYTVLNDTGKYSYQDRTALAIHYLGSKGNDDKDNTIYPYRRLLLADNLTSWGNSTDFQYNQLPVQIGNNTLKVPVGLVTSVHHNVLDIKKTDNNPIIFMNSTGYKTVYYNTYSRNQTLLDDSNAVGINFNLSWMGLMNPLIVNYTLPNPQQAISNKLTVTTIPVSPTNKLVTTVDINRKTDVPKGGIYETTKRFAYNQVMKEIGDPIMAVSVSNDMPNDGVRGNSTTGSISLSVHKFNVFIPDWAKNELNTFSDVIDSSPTAITVKVVSNTTTYTKEYPIYSFDSNYKISIDTRQNVTLSIWRGEGNTVVVKAPWTIDKISGGGKIESCSGDTCYLSVYDNSTRITAYNEFGGSGTVKIPPAISPINPLNPTVQDRLETSIAVIIAVILIMYISKKLLGVTTGTKP